MFNKHNPTEQKILRILGYGEGIISKEQFLSISNKTMLSKYITAGFLEQKPNAMKGTYQTTSKFQREFKRNVEPNISFSGSGSLTHSAELNTVLSTLPSDVYLKTGQALKQELREFRNTPEYLKSIFQIQDRDSRLLESVKAENEATRNPCFKAAQTYHLNSAQARYELSHSDHACSAPDLQVTIDVMDAFEWAERLSEIGEMETRKGVHKTTYCAAADMINRLATTATTDQITFCVEIITSNYSTTDSLAKDNYAEVTHSNLVYIAA